MKLLEFPHSPFCEKARWALDHKRVPFKRVAILPGLHMITVRKYAPGTSVPVLLTGNTVVQGSTAIIDYLEENFPDFALNPDSEDEQRKCFEIEETIASPLGERIRKIFYFWLLPYPGYLCKRFTHSMAWPKQLAFYCIFPVLRKKIYQGYVRSEQNVIRARSLFAETLDELAIRLKNKEYLIGDRFSRADISVAAMLSELVSPPEYPGACGEDIPSKEAVDFVAGYSDHPVSEWVRKIYREHR